MIFFPDDKGGLEVKKQARWKKNFA